MTWDELLKTIAPGDHDCRTCTWSRWRTGEAPWMQWPDRGCRYGSRPEHLDTAPMGEIGSWQMYQRGVPAIGPTEADFAADASWGPLPCPGYQREHVTIIARTTNGEIVVVDRDGRRALTTGS